MRILRDLILLSIAALCTTTGSGPVTAWAQTAPVQGGTQDPRQGPPGTIRVRVRLIPVDVIVTDTHDRPIADLKQEDFQVFENGRRQEIQHFSVQILTPAATEAGGATTLRKVPTLELAPQASRTFLIMLGRGRHQQTVKAIDSLIRFVRKDLLPQDRVAVFAYNRATDFTTEHERIAEVLERYKQVHPNIESWLESMFRGLAGIYGTKEIPKSFQPEIDRIFANPELASRRVTPGRMTEKGTMAREAEQVSAVLQRAELAKMMADLAGEGARGDIGDPFDALEAEALTDLPFDTYAATSAITYQDMLNLYTCIEYMRYMEGEKHLLFFTEDGLFLPKTESDKGLAAVANDARVIIDTFQTGGVFVDTSGIAKPPPVISGRTPPVIQPPFTNASWSRAMALASLRSVSRLTGGRSAIMQDLGRALTRLNETSRVEYLLGYYPKDESWDGKYRQINVKVNRPGVNVAFRHGYYARDTLQPYDREAFLSYSRISAAGAHEGELKDVLFKISTMEVKDALGQPQIRIDLRIDPGGIGFKTIDGLHLDKLHITVFYADNAGHYLGDDWKTMDMRLEEPNYRQTLQSGIWFSTLVPRKTDRQVLKVVVYDAGNDRVGSALVKLR